MAGAGNTRDEAPGGAPEDEGGAPPPTGRVSRFFKLSSLSGGVMATSALGAVKKAFSGRAKAAAIDAKANLDKARKIVETFGELKGAVMKLGQVISIQEDAVPPEFRDVLSRLQSQAPPMHPSYAIDVIESELGRRLPDLFADFERKPFANYMALIRKVIARDHDGILDVYERMGFLTREERTTERIQEWLKWSYLCCTGLDEDRVFPDPARGESWGKFITDLHGSLNRHMFKVGTYTPKDAVYLNRVTLGIMCFWKRLDARGNWHRIMLRHIEAAEKRLGAPR